MNKATCKTCGTTGPPWNHKPTVLATNHGVSQTEPPTNTHTSKGGLG